MPILSKFYGITIRMYFQQSEHNPPHIHSLYGDDIVAVEIQTGDILEGNFPPKALSMVREWTELHKDDLLQIWKTQEFIKLPPLE